MRKLHRQSLGWLLALSLPLTLCGCQTEQADNQNQQQTDLPRQEAEQPTESEDSITDTPGLLLYDDSDGYGIINTEGKLILPTDYTAKQLLLDDENHQIGVMTQQHFEDTARLDSWGDPLPDGAEYCFYDPQGELICKVDLRGMGSVWFEQYPADLQRSLFFCDMVSIDGTMRVIRLDGTELIREQLDPDVTNCLVSEVLQAEDWIKFFYERFSTGNEGFIGTKRSFYTSDGQPLTLAQNYLDIDQLHDSGSSDYAPNRVFTGYYSAHYYDEQGKSRFDIIDGHGNVLLSGADGLGRYQSGVLSYTKDGIKAMLTLTDAPTDTPRLMYSDHDSSYPQSGIINTAGAEILPADSTNKYILYDITDQQIGVMQQIEHKDRLDYWGQTTTSGSEYHFYDTQGELTHTVDLSGMGETKFSQYMADLQRSLFLCNSIPQDNSIRVVDMNGNALVTRQLDWLADNYGWHITDASCDILLADDWFMLSWHLYGFDKEDETKHHRQLTDRWEFYTTDGQPLTFAKDYHIIQPIEDDMLEATRVSVARPQPQYYKARHYDNNGTSLLDVIDGCGNVVISDLTEIYRYHDGVFVCIKDNKRGLMDAEGNWLHIQQ